jgi:hypothetical protein
VLALVWLALSAGLILGTHPAQAQPARWNPGEPGENLEIALLTISPGEVYWQRYGHNAILVRDRANGEATLYNYGIFDFAQKNFFWNFLRGRMRYRIVGLPPEHDLANYAAEGRGVEAQLLNLSPSQRLALRDFLAWNARPENAEYRYDYFVANCSTKVRDALDRVLGGALERALASGSEERTYRMHALRLMAPELPLAIGIHAGLSGYADRPISHWAEAFVPAELQRRVRRVRVRDDAGAEAPLVAAESTLLPPRLAPPPAEPPHWLGGFLGTGLGLAGVLAIGVFGRRHAALRRLFAALAVVLYLIAGLGGLLLLFLWIGTEHRAAWRNESLLLFNPLCLLVLPALTRFARSDWAPLPLERFLFGLIQVAAMAAVTVKAMPQLVQANLEWIALWLPTHLIVGVPWQYTRPVPGAP